MHRLYPCPVFLIGLLMKSRQWTSKPADTADLGELNRELGVGRLEISQLYKRRGEQQYPSRFNKKEGKNKGKYPLPTSHLFKL